MTDIFEVKDELETLYLRDEKAYHALEEHHSQVGNALLDLREKGDMISAVEIVEDSGVAQGPVNDVIDALYVMERIEAEKEDDTKFYDLNSYTIGDFNAVKAALDNFNPETEFGY
ncbi:MAG: hypothetical protein ABEJ99_04940 [Candidatus Nanohaloarchaea archaeon]